MSEHRDPAVEAAQRAWHGNSDNDGGDPQIDVHDRRVWDTSEAAAREALAPIRAIVERLDYEQENFRGDSLDYLDLAQGAIEDIRLLIYSGKELSDD